MSRTTSATQLAPNSPMRRSVSCVKKFLGIGRSSVIRSPTISASSTQGFSGYDVNGVYPKFLALFWLSCRRIATRNCALPRVARWLKAPLKAPKSAPAAFLGRPTQVQTHRAGSRALRCEGFLANGLVGLASGRLEPRAGGPIRLWNENGCCELDR